MFLIRNIINKQHIQSLVRYFSRDVPRKSSAFHKTPILYGDEASPPVRVVMMTASVLGIDYKFHEIDLFCSDHKTDFYTKINPLQKVPAFAVGDRVICDSHAIALYLCRKSKNSVLYPEDSKTKAQIDEMMYFDAGSLFPTDASIYYDFFAGKWPADEEKLAQWYRLLDYLELRLKKRPYLAGDKAYLCDFSCATTLTSLQLVIPLLDRHKEIGKWLDRLHELPCFEINTRGLKRMQVFVDKVKSIL